MYEVEFKKQDLIITDPCYLSNTVDGECNLDFWDDFCFGSTSGKDLNTGLSKYGFGTNIACDTKYGDWSCTLFNMKDFDPREITDFDKLKLVAHSTEKDIDKMIGRFCADAGMVCVVTAEDLKKFNPGFFEWAFFHPHCVSLVRMFTGTVGVLDINPNSESFPHYRHRIIYGITDKSANPYSYNFLSLQTGY